MKIVSVGTAVAWGTAFLGHGVVRRDAMCLGTTCSMVFFLPLPFLV